MILLEYGIAASPVHFRPAVRRRLLSDVLLASC